MFRATIKGLLAKKFRLILTAISVVLGVGFVAGTYVLTDTMNAAFDDLFSTTAQASDVTVRAQNAFDAEGGPGGSGNEGREPIPEDILPTVESVPAVASASGDVTGYAQIINPNTGEAIGGFGPPTIGLNWTDTSSDVLSIRDGEAPAGPSDVLIDAGTAASNDIAVGDTLEILLVGGPREFTVSGIAGFGDADNLAGATLAVFDTPTAQEVLDKEGVYDAISVIGVEGVSATELRDDVGAVLPDGVEAVTTATVGEENAEQLQEGLGFFQTFLLVFAGVSLFVGSFIIFNTFSIIVAQRTRELALFRALGASRRQVMTSVIVEAGVVGLVASVIGLAFGVVVAILLRGLLGLIGIDLPSTSLQILPRTIVVSVIVGVIVTLIAAIIPARRAARVAPVEALREADPSAVRERGLGRRLALGLVVTGLGVAALAYGLFGQPSNAATLVGLGAAVTFLGVTMLSPLFAGPVSSAIGAPLARLGLASKIGRRNAIRNPRRTARTSAALMIGLGLVAMVAILGASLKGSFTAALEETLRADFTVSTQSFLPFSPDVAARIEQIPDAEAVSRFRTAGFRVNDQTSFLTAVQPDTLDAVAEIDLVQGDLADLGTEQILVHEDLATSKGWALGDEVPAAFASVGDRPLTIAGIYARNEMLGDYAINRELYDELYTENLDDFVLVKLREGADPATAQSEIEDAVAPFRNIEVLDQTGFREKQAGFLDQLLGLVTVLLFFAIMIAWFGIVNTLSLSIHERTRELGLLRAVGLSRKQVKRMIRIEAAIIALFGAVLGLVIGIVFGWALQQALEPEGVSELVIPGGSLVIYLIFAGVAGVLAAIGPARRASKLDVLQSIAYE
ncbi:MAG TPA: FtsX-like permease family protein [Actinomycetota bacterium]